MANVYVWEYVKGSVGHCSLLLDNGIYISWWPKENKLKFMKMNKKVTAQGSFPHKYQEDVEQMGRKADHVFYISNDKVTTKDVMEWWIPYKERASGYHFISHNCCDVVLKALKAGGAFEWKHPGIKVISTPRYMVRYGKALEAAGEKNSQWFYIL